MPRLAHTTPLLVSLLALVACPAGDDAPADTEATTSGGSTEAPTTMTPTTMTPTTMVDPDTTTATTMVDPDTSSSGEPQPLCEPECPAGECCLGGVCFGAPEPVCPGGCGAFEVCQCPEGSDPCDCVAECDACGVEGGAGNDPCIGVECPAGSFCVVDDPAAPSFGWCASQGCGADDCACPLPAAGATATPACGAFEGDEGNGSCFLDCGEGSCPEGMACRSVGDQSVCVWEQVITLPGYGDCADNPLSTCQASEDACLADAGGTAGACSETGCADAGDCLAAPATGNAPVTCGDLGDGNTCYLDCAAKQTCPDGTVCTVVGTGSACLWADDGFVLDEDFELGELRPAWSVIDVDGHTPDPAVEFVSAAWVVTDEFEAGTNFGAYSTSWYAPLDQSDDWLITPQITLGSGSILTWDAWAPDQAFADGYEVRVSTGDATVMDFMVDMPVFTIDDEADPYASHMVDLAAAGFMNEDVYIAFRNNSDDDFILVVDNVRVTE